MLRRVVTFSTEGYLEEPGSPPNDDVRRNFMLAQRVRVLSCLSVADLWYSAYQLHEPQEVTC